MSHSVIPDLTSGPAGAVAAVVLAAGLSSRMGLFKPLLPFGTATVLDHVVGRLREAGVTDVHVVVGHRAELMAAQVRRVGALPVVNAAFRSGMYSSVRAGIASLAADVEGCLLLPIDVPLLRASTHGRILAAARQSGAPLVHPVFRGRRGHPPFIGRALFADILARGDRLSDVLDAHEAEAVTVEVFDRGALADMDYPEEHACLLEALAHHHAPDAEECEAMLDAAGAGQGIRAHGRAVAALALTLGRGLAATGLALDLDLLVAGARLHDIGKGHPHHAAIGADLVRDYGFANLHDIIARHMDLDFTGGRLDEAALVFLADKLTAGTEPVGLDQRFAPAFARFRNDPAALAGVRRKRAAAEAVLHAVGSLIDLPDFDAPAEIAPLADRATTRSLQ